ncbi:extracellular solute-binding protein [Paenibacillus senegalensis]|uniref:extracellular solute-binding protein n=1 Tax=Paenibacillus senegalensis TaxID=1465766 RepID=UPI000288E380|nr:extracellular solute-binding protein [Paenibacillus senegalensis]
MKGKQAAITILSLALVATACSGGGTEGTGGTGGSDDPPTPGGSPQAVENLNPSGFPIVDEPIQLRFVAGRSATTAQDWNNVMLFDEYEKMTGIDIQWQMIGTEVLSEQRNLMLTGGDLPDAFYAASVPNQDIMRYGMQGAFIPLNDLIEEHAPNIKQLLDDNPDIRKGMTMPDGNIYSIPRVYDPEFDSVFYNPKLWVNEELMQELNLDMPQTTDEFYDFLVKLKEANGGNAPFGADNINRIIKLFNGFWGLQNKGSQHAYVDIDPDTNELRFIPTEEKYKEMLQYLNRLYEDGLIDRDIFTINSTEFTVRLQDDRYGAFIGWDPISYDLGEEFVGADVLEGPHGDKTVVKNSTIAGLGTFVITNANKHPEATMRWIDYFFSEEGMRMFYAGFEGVTYEVTDGGEIQYVEEIMNHPDGLSFEQALVKYLVWPGGGMPGIISQSYFFGGESLPSSIAAADKVKQYMNEEAWPAFSYKEEEVDRMNALSSDINTYIREQQAKFISGAASFAEWDSYVQTIQRMGLEDYMQIYQAAYDRYRSDN